MAPVKMSLTPIPKPVEKTRVVPIHRRKNRPIEVTGQWGSLLMGQWGTLFTTVLKASTPLSFYLTLLGTNIDK